MVIIRRGLFTQAYPTRPLLSTFEEFLVEEEQAKEAALKEAIEAALKKVNDAKAGRMGKKKEATWKAKADVKAAKKEATKKKDSTKGPSIEEKQAKEAALKKEAVYQQKIAAWKQSTQDKVNIIKAAEEADDKKEQEKVARIKAARKKATLKEEQAKEAALKKVVIHGQKIAAWE